ncbi:MAG: hypothetical protein V1769_03750, partial [Thermoplasmatota archaeon]
EFYYRVYVVYVEAIKLWEDVVGKYFMCDSTISRWRFLKNWTFLNFCSEAFYPSNWTQLVKTNVSGVFLHDFPIGIYKIHFFIQ